MIYNRKRNRLEGYDHIILNDNELNRISDYIEKNPQLWKQDEYLIELEKMADQ